MITSQLLDTIRSRTGEFLTDSCLIERASDTVDENNAWDGSWQIVASNVACRVIKVGQLTKSMSEEVGSAEALTEMYRLIVPYTTDLGVNYRVTVGGNTFQVVTLENALTDRAFRSAIVSRQL